VQDQAATPAPPVSRRRRVARFVLRWLVLTPAVLLAVAIGTLIGIRSWLQDVNAANGRIVSPQGIDEAGYVMLGGARQWVTIRGQDRRNPVILYLHGGPGGTTSDVAYGFQRPWEDDFTVVQWDQRGFGRSAVDGETLGGTITGAQLVDDAVALIEHIDARLGQSKVILVGQSWGTVLGAEVAKRRPDLLHAYLGFGQLTGWKRNFEETRAELSQIAKARGDAALAKAMRDAGPAPDPHDPKAFFAWVNTVQAPVLTEGGSWHNVRTTGDLTARMLAMMFGSPTLSLTDIWRTLGAAPGPDFALYPLAASVAGWDFRKTLGVDFDVPMIFVSGRYDLQTPRAAVQRLAAEICAPHTEMIVVENSAHFLVTEQPGSVLDALLKARRFATGEATFAPPPCKRGNG